MSLLSQAAQLMTYHSVIVILLLPTGVWRRMTQLDDDSSLDQFESDSPEAETVSYFERLSLTTYGTRGLFNPTDASDAFYSPEDQDSSVTYPIQRQMARDSTVRPWLAAGLTILVAGLGHLYLRQWVRAIGWFGLIVLTGALFGPENLPQSPGDADLGEIVPVIGVALLAVVDAYLQARRHNARIRIAHREACANCGRSVDPDLEFCHWCSEPLVDESLLAEADEADTDAAQ